MTWSERNRGLYRSFALLLVLALLGRRQAAAAPEKPLPETAQRNPNVEFARLQGVWEQSGQRDFKGHQEERNPSLFFMGRNVLIVAGQRVYTIHTLGPGVLKYEDMSLPPDADPRAIDFVNPTSNQTIRGLYDFQDETLRLCYRVKGRRTLQRPTAMAPTKDGFEVLSYKKLAMPETLAKFRTNSSGNDPLAGVWKTVAYESNGVKLESQSPEDVLQDPLRDQHRVCYFRAGILTTFRHLSPEPNRELLQISHWAYQAEGRSLTFTKPDGTKLLAVFEAKGDQLTLCCADEGGPRPDQLRTQRGDGRWLLRLERVDEPPTDAKQGQE